MILLLFLLTLAIGLLAKWHVKRTYARHSRTSVQSGHTGPDIHAAARDHTLEAVWLKVTKNLRQQIERRKSWPQLRVKTQRHHSLVVGQRA